MQNSGFYANADNQESYGGHLGCWRKTLTRTVASAEKLEPPELS